MKKIVFLTLLSLIMNAVVSQNSIQVGNDGKSWNVVTRSTVYHLKVENGDVRMVSYGDKSLIEWAGRPLGAEVPARGGFANATPQIEVIFADGVRDIELAFKSFEIVTINGYQTLKITQADKYYLFEVVSFIASIPEYDLIEKWIEVRNTGKKGIIKVENLLSGSVFLPKDAYELTHYSAVWGYEFTPHTTKLTPGVKTIQVKDFKSYGSSSFMVRPEGETDPFNGKVWFGSIKYSGNWRVDFDKSFNGPLQIVSGMNFWDQEFYLKPGQVFTTPSVVFGYTNKGTEGVTHSLTAYIREQLLPSSHREKTRPVLYNSWYATTFNVNEEHQLALAKVAKELGVEVFVIDDGWFKGRVNDRAGLGDWTVDLNKFPNGLQPMIEKINALGLDFGIWIEPEMVNPNSDLYRAHPDWVFHFPNRERHLGRNQLILNLAREDVYQYLYQSFHKLLKENNIKFIKWDMNKMMSDPGFPAAPADEQRAVRINYVENLYRLVETLRKEFPDVWFENCSSGGGRIDMAMNSRFDFNWASDNTDPVDRIFIQDAYLTLFPSNTMISWVTHEDHHRQNHPLEYKFDVCMAGVLGVGYDITKWTDKEKEVAKAKIARYKEIRKTVHTGTPYRLISPFYENRSILQFVNKEQTESIVFAYQLAELPNNMTNETKRSPLVQLRGLSPTTRYSVEGVEGVYSGDFLMKTGIEMPLRGAFKSRILKITKQ